MTELITFESKLTAAVAADDVSRRPLIIAAAPAPIAAVVTAIPENVAAAPIPIAPSVTQ